jgi:hypothetical protein
MAVKVLAIQLMHLAAVVELVLPDLPELVGKAARAEMVLHLRFLALQLLMAVAAVEAVLQRIQTLPEQVVQVAAVLVLMAVLQQQGLQI